MRFLILLLALIAGNAAAETGVKVGETHRTITYPGAAVRDAQARALLRITIWYPAAAGAVEQPIVIGPDGNPIFMIGAAAPDAPFAADRAGTRRPIILLSHGFGGTARIMGWFGIALARAGYVVVAVDHPGNNGLDPMTVAGALLVWQRAEDLREALHAAVADAVIGPHIDATRVGLAGFSLGGLTALVGAGARPDLARLERFCAAHSEDGVCKPQREFPVTAAQRAAFEQDPSHAEVLSHMNDDRAIPHVRAAFLMAPAVMQALDPAELRHIRIPVSIVLGDGDVVAPPETNGMVAARAIPHARLQVMPGVGHYVFLADCAPGVDLPFCAPSARRVDPHRAAIAAAERLFATALR